jgi:hypothetical protein
MPESEILAREYPFMTTPPSPRCGSCVYLEPLIVSTKQHRRPTLASKSSVISEPKSFLNGNLLQNPVTSWIFSLSIPKRCGCTCFTMDPCTPLVVAYKSSDCLRAMRSKRTLLLVSAGRMQLLLLGVFTEYNVRLLLASA